MLKRDPGIGTQRRQALSSISGGLRGVQAAAIDDIAKVEGDQPSLGRAHLPAPARVGEHLMPLNVPNLITLSRHHPDSR